MATSKLASALIQQPPQILNPVKKKPVPVGPGFTDTSSSALAASLGKHAAPPPPQRIGIPDQPWQVGLAPKPAAPAATAPPAGTPGATATPGGAGTPGASASALVNALLKPFLDEINAAADRRSQAGTAAITGYTNDLAAKLGGIDLTSPYTAAEGRQASADAALQQSLTGGGTQLANDLNTRLASINDPAVAQAASGLASRGAALGTTELARGTTSLSNLIANGAAAGSYGQKLPGIAGLSGLQGVKQLQSQIAGDTSNQIGSLKAQVPGMVQTELSNEAKAQQDAQRINPTLSAAAGHAVNDFGAPVLQGGKPVPYTPYEKPSAGSTKVIKGPDGYYSVDSAGHATKLGVGLPPSSTKAATTHLQSKTVNGHTVTFDPTTGTYYVPGTTTTVDPNSLSKPVKVSASALSHARQYLQQSSKGFYASQADPTKPVTASQVAAAAKAAGMTVADFLQNADAKAAAGIGWNQVADHEDSHIQDIYTTLVKQYGIPARQAFNMVAGTYKQWGQAKRSAYFPKAEAAQGAAENAAYVTVSPGANRPGAHLNTAVVQFVGKVGEIAGRKLTIGTGTNHSEYVAGTTRQSAHWTGNAADVPATGANLTYLGQEALIAAGANPAWARKQTGGLFNVGGYQIIFNSMEGGNHFNHLHVGMRGGTAAAPSSPPASASSATTSAKSTNDLYPGLHPGTHLSMKQGVMVDQRGRRVAMVSENPLRYAYVG